MSQSLQIHQKLREMILSLEVRPGEKLSERWLETQFDGSRTPIRAALFRLETEELIRRDGRAWVVAPIDIDEIAALAEYREPLEAAVVRLACERATDNDIAAVSEILNACRPDVPREQWHQMGTDFHIELARLAGNAFMLKSVQGVMTRLARVRWLEVMTEARREQSWREHRRILDCIQARQPEDAAREAVQHIRDTRDRLLASLHNDRQYLRAHGMSIVGKRHA